LLAIWAADRPARTCGLYCAPARVYRLAMSRNGTAPDWSALLTQGGTSKVPIRQLGRPQRELGALVVSGPERERGGVRVYVGGR
jgi:hypothetical protein